jgi:hypothetical protein
VSQRHATIQGEVHGGSGDTRALIDRGLGEYDAVMVEGRSPTIVVRQLTLGYAAFLIGYVTLMWVQAVVGRIRRRIADRVDLRAVADDLDIDYHDRIDADTETAYEMAPRLVKYLLGATLLALLTVAILVGINRLVLAALALSTPHLYTTLTVAIVKTTTEGRATYMADRITALADESSYDRVAVLCGEAHRKDVASALECREWSVTTYRSTHPLGRFRLFGE